jgi:hypothetical protein
VMVLWLGVPAIKRMTFKPRVERLVSIVLLSFA